MPKGGKREGAGRPEGSGGAVSQVLRDRITKADPIGFLIDSMNGKAVNGEVLKHKERADIATHLSKKIVPDLKSMEYKSEDGGPMVIKMINYGDLKDD